MIEIGVKVEAAWSLLGWIHSKNDRGLHFYFYFNDDFVTLDVSS